MSKSKYTIEKLQKIFSLDSKSPSGLSWKISPVMGNGAGYQYATAGDPVGYFNKYWTVSHGGIKYRLHRVVYVLAFGNIPDDQVVDHINRNTSDNSLTNLRVISKKLNSRNMSKFKTNTSGFTGVHLDIKRKDAIFFVSTWYDITGRKRTKSFSIFKYGIIESQFMACKYRRDKVNEMNLYGSGYTETHGK